MPRCFVTIMGAPIVSPTNARFKTAASKITATNDAFCNRYRIDSRKSFRHVVRQNELGIGEWQSVDQNELRIKIWDNGNPEEAGTVRIYRRLNEEG